MNHCIGCEGQVKPEEKGVLTEVVGWSEQRSAGGLNHLIRRTSTGRYVHKACLEPDAGQQEALFK